MEMQSATADEVTANEVTTTEPTGPAHRQTGWALNGLLALALLLSVGMGWVVATDAWPWLRGPAPYPPEWRWLYVPLHWSGRNSLHLALVLIYAAGVLWLTRGPLRATKVRLALGMAVVFLFVWQLAQIWVRETSLFDTLIFRTYAPPLNGYFVAPAQVDSIGETLRHYLAAMPTFFAQKQKTHPPGLFLFYAFFQELYAHLPRFSAWFAPIARTWALPGRDWPLLADHLIASAFTTAWVQIILTALAPLPLYALLGQLRLRRRTALWCALLFPLLPSVTIFSLQWDTLYPTLGFAAWYLALRGQDRLQATGLASGQGIVRSNDGRLRKVAGSIGMGRWLDWLWAGLLLSLLTWLSFGNLVFGLMIGLHLLWRAFWDGVEGRRKRERGREKASLFSHGRNTFLGLALMGTGVALPWLLAYLVWNMNFFDLMAFGLASHYDIVTAHRDYAIWWWMNLVDFGLWLGAGLLLLGLGGTVWLLWRSATDVVRRDLAGLALVFWSVLLLLDVSGTTRGEIGRLWIFLMPFPLVFGLALPWKQWQRGLILGALVLHGWVMAFVIASFLCC